MIKVLYVELFKAAFTHAFNDQNTQQRKKLKLPYLHYYTRNICEIWSVENLLGRERIVW